MCSLFRIICQCCLNLQLEFRDERTGGGSKREGKRKSDFDSILFALRMSKTSQFSSYFLLQMTSSHNNISRSRTNKLCPHFIALWPDGITFCRIHLQRFMSPPVFSLLWTNLTSLGLGFFLLTCCHSPRYDDDSGFISIS